jgi:hypothetical protein
MPAVAPDWPQYRQPKLHGRAHTGHASHLFDACSVPAAGCGNCEVALLWKVANKSNHGIAAISRCRVAAPDCTTPPTEAPWQGIIQNTLHLLMPPRSLHGRCVSEDYCIMNCGVIEIKSNHVLMLNRDARAVAAPIGLNTANRTPAGAYRPCIAPLFVHSVPAAGVCS